MEPNKVPFSEDLIMQPEDVYGSAKTSMEVITRVLSNVYGFKYLIIRPHNVYGTRQKFIRSIQKCHRHFP